jgi:hypothetical protein
LELVNGAVSINNSFVLIDLLDDAIHLEPTLSGKISGADCSPATNQADEFIQSRQAQASAYS